MTANLEPSKLAAMRRIFLRHALFLLLLVVAPVAQATAPEASSESTSRHRFTVDGAATDFMVTAATLPFTSDPGERQAGIFHVAYTRDGATPAARPVTFVFNGGPGASSAYLHLGVLGPRSIDIGPGGQLPAPAAPLIDNPDHWLDLTDLVFIDPVGTGYSPAHGNGGRHWGQAEDLASLASFIDRYLTAAGRRASPVYLAGESYGGFRAARLPEVLASKHRVEVAGAFLISPVLEFSLISGDSFSLLTDVLRLPSYAAVALERSGTPPAEALAEAERFALGPYLTALAATPRNPEQMGEIAREVARLTGLPEAVIARHDGRLPLGVFVKEARRADKLLSSRYDGSITGPDPHPDSARARGDALFDPLRVLLTESMTAYLSSLGVRTDLPYQLSNTQVLRQWNWRSGMGGRDGHAGAADSLGDTLERNRAFKVAIAHGMTDLVTPYMTSRYVIDHLPASLTAGRVSLSVHPGGHMMYLRAVSRAGLKAEAIKLFRAAE